jgi:hypothetical protein
MVAPQVPTRWAIGQAVLDHESHRQINHAVGIVTARWRQLREVGVEVLMTFRTVVLRIGDPQVTGAPGVEIAEIMQRALLALVAIGLMSTTRTGVVCGVATAVKNLWLGESLRACNAFRGIGPVDAGSWHTWVLHGNKGGTGTRRYMVPLCPHATRFLYYSVRLCGTSPSIFYDKSKHTKQA